MPEKPDYQAVCARCGRATDPADRYLIRDGEGPGAAAICRVEHIVAWVLRGAAWQIERPWEVDETARAAHGGVIVERHRAGTVATEVFEDVEALRSWASSGGPWARS